ncbi:hypothetical protein OFM04_35525, partial [Escherichia coli]|nr:hypothetical protein [Escherichia coli]
PEMFGVGARGAARPVLLEETAPSRLSFAVAYPLETFFLPGGLLLLGRAREAAVTLAAMLAAIVLARARRRRA